MVRMLGAVAPECGHSLIDLDGMSIGAQSPTRSRTPWLALTRKLLHLRTLVFFGSAFPRTSLVFFQTSMNRNSISRDAAYMYRCFRAGRAFSVFFHGWNEHFAGWVSASMWRRQKIAEILSHATRIFVLAPGFKDTLSSWGVDSRKVVVETTMIDDSILAGFDLEQKIRSRRPVDGLRVLFLSRITKEKGVYQAVDAFRLHRTRFPSSSLVIAGDGEELRGVKEKVRRESIHGVRFAGFVCGAEKARLLTDSDVFLLPSYREGLPVSLLEAMAFGCTVISRPVGGIGHFFRSPEMGYLEAGLEPMHYAGLLDKVMRNPNSWAATARFNHEFTRENTLASRVGRRILDEVTKDLDHEIVPT